MKDDAARGREGKRAGQGRYAQHLQGVMAGPCATGPSRRDPCRKCSGVAGARAVPTHDGAAAGADPRRGHARADRGGRRKARSSITPQSTCRGGKKSPKGLRGERYPGVAVRVERTGAERVFQRIGQEYGSRMDLLSTSSTPPTPRDFHRMGSRRPAGVHRCRRMLLSIIRPITRTPMRSVR